MLTIAPLPASAAAAPSSSSSSEIHPNLCPSLRSSVLFMDTAFSYFPSQTIPSVQLTGPSSLDDLLQQQVYRVIQATGVFIDDISSRFFQGFHRWVPIVSRVRFQDELFNGHSPPRADFSILLLSMCLITYRLSEQSGSAFGLDSLYLLTKMLYAHVQGLIPASTCLIQAGLVISVFEYLHGSGKGAFMSIGLCARMAYATGIYHISSSPPILDHEAWLKAEEARNVWWAIVIFERSVTVMLSLCGNNYWRSNGC